MEQHSVSPNMLYWGADWNSIHPIYVICMIYISKINIFINFWINTVNKTKCTFWYYDCPSKYVTITSNVFKVSWLHTEKMLFIFPKIKIVFLHMVKLECLHQCFDSLCPKKLGHQICCHLCMATKIGSQCKFSVSPLGLHKARCWFSRKMAAINGSPHLHIRHNLSGLYIIECKWLIWLLLLLTHCDIQWCVALHQIQQTSVKS